MINKLKVKNRECHHRRRGRWSLEIVWNSKRIFEEVEIHGPIDCSNLVYLKQNNALRVPKGKDVLFSFGNDCLEALKYGETERWLSIGGEDARC